MKAKIIVSTIMETGQVGRILNLNGATLLGFKEKDFFYFSTKLLHL